MTQRYEEYLRRNLLLAKAIGAKAGASTALKRLEMQTRPPKWLVNALRGILERCDPLPAELAKWRDLAPDTPDYIRAELETSVQRVEGVVPDSNLERQIQSARKAIEGWPDDVKRAMRIPTETSPVREQESFMPRVNGLPFRCECGCNVFHKDGEGRYCCNACPLVYAGE